MSKIKLTWTPVKNGTQYQPQYRAQGATAWANFGIALPEGTLAVEIDNLTPDASYEFQVLARGNATIPAETVSNITQAKAPPAAVAGAPYTPVPTYKSTWLGNSLGSKDLTSPRINNAHVQTHIDAMLVLPDGTVFPTAYYSEGGTQDQVMKDGRLIHRGPVIMTYGERGGRALCANARYLIYPQHLISGVQTAQYPLSNPNNYWLGFQVYHNSLANNYGRANIAGGMDVGGGTSFIPVLQFAHPAEGYRSFSGAACTATRLYLSDPYNNIVRMYAIGDGTFTPSGTFPIMNPGQIVIAPDGSLLIVVGKEIHQYTPDGATRLGVITGFADWRPTGVAIAPAGSLDAGRLLVGDDGPRQQVHFFNLPARSYSHSRGVQGGVLAGPTPGQMGDLRFHQPNAVGMDSAGNLYVNNVGSATDMRCISPSDTLVWRLIGTVFIDVAVGEPGSELTRLYTYKDGWDMDWSKGDGAEAKWATHDVDHIKYPRDPRIDPTTSFSQKPLGVFAVRRLGGKKFKILTDQDGRVLMFYRYDGEIAVPALYFLNNKLPGWSAHQPGGRSIWRDLNLNGADDAGEFFQDSPVTDDGDYGLSWQIDAVGDVWHSIELFPGVSRPAGPIERFRFGGLDANGIPLYSHKPGTSPGQMTSYAAPEGFTVVSRIYYDQPNDVMYVAGYTPANPGLGGGGAIAPLSGVCGTEMARFDHWEGRNGTRKKVWQVLLPYRNEGVHYHSVIVHTFDIAGDYIFLGLYATVYSNGVLTPETASTEMVRVLHKSTGVRHGHLIPGPEIGGNHSHIDMKYGLRAMRKPSNLEYILSIEDVVHGKVDLLRGLMNTISI